MGQPTYKRAKIKPKQKVLSFEAHLKQRIVTDVSACYGIESNSVLGDFTRTTLDHLVETTKTYRDETLCMTRLKAELAYKVHEAKEFYTDLTA